MRGEPVTGDAIGNRRLCLGGACVNLSWTSTSLAQLVDRLFPYHSAAGTAAIDVQMELVLHEDDPVYELREKAVPVYRGDSFGMLAGLLVNRVLFHIADQCRSGPLFHAAAASRDGRVWMVPGQSGAGKTTLVSWLLYRGFSYLTDELVWLSPDDHRLHGFYRPLNFKPDSARLLEREAARDLSTGADLVSHLGELVSPALIGNAPVETCGAAARIIVPRYSKASGLRLTRLSAGRAVGPLMECLVNARNLAGDGFPDVTRLARAVPAWELCYGSFNDLDDAVEELASAAGID